jgi:hypothetical protein
LPIALAAGPLASGIAPLALGISALATGFFHNAKGTAPKPAFSEKSADYYGYFHRGQKGVMSSRPFLTAAGLLPSPFLKAQTPREKRSGKAQGRP